MASFMSNCVDKKGLVILTLDIEQIFFLFLSYLQRMMPTDKLAEEEGRRRTNRQWTICCCDSFWQMSDLWRHAFFLTQLSDSLTTLSTTWLLCSCLFSSASWWSFVLRFFVFVLKQIIVRTLLILLELKLIIALQMVFTFMINFTLSLWSWTMSTKKNV